MINLEEIWEDYRRAVLPADAHSVQVTETKRAFFAGFRRAMDVTFALSQAAETEAEEEAAVQILDLAYSTIESWGRRGGRGPIGPIGKTH